MFHLRWESQDRGPPRLFSDEQTENQRKVMRVLVGGQEWRPGCAWALPSPSALCFPCKISILGGGGSGLHCPQMTLGSEVTRPTCQGGGWQLLCKCAFPRLFWRKERQVWLPRGEVAPGHTVPASAASRALVCWTLCPPRWPRHPQDGSAHAQSRRRDLELQDGLCRGAEGWGAGEQMWGVPGWAPGQLECLQ